MSCFISPAKQATAFNIDEVWSMDFVADQRFDGRKIRALPVVDIYSRQCPVIQVDRSLEGGDVVNVLDGLGRRPLQVKVDNESEFLWGRGSPFPCLY